MPKAPQLGQRPVRLRAMISPRLTCISCGSRNGNNWRLARSHRVSDSSFLVAEDAARREPVMSGGEVPYLFGNSWLVICYEVGRVPTFNGSAEIILRADSRQNDEHSIYTTWHS